MCISDAVNHARRQRQISGSVPVLCLILLAVFAVSGISGCAPKLESGTIVAKNRFEPWLREATRTKPAFMYPERWEVTIRGTVKGRVVENSFFVTESEWNRLKIGDTYPSPVNYLLRYHGER